MIYDLSSYAAIVEAGKQATTRANAEPNQASYNAGWLHGYARALADVRRGLDPEAQQLGVHRLNALRVNLDSVGLPDAYCLICSNPKEPPKHRDFLLAHDSIGIIVYMFGCRVDSDAEAVALAEANAPDYAPEIFDPE